MANAGNHSDTLFLKTMIGAGKFVTIDENDHPMMKTIKEKFNEVVSKDEVRSYRHDGKKYLMHSSYGHMYRTLIKINQMRCKNWYFIPVSGKLVIPS